MHDLDETIVAVATPPGRGGVGCVRLSGPDARQIAHAFFRPAGRQPESGAPRFGRFYDREEFPGPGVESDDEILDFARRRGTTAFHPMGTCRMGPQSDPGAVVDDELRVHGVDGLRVVDASVMPTMPSANTNASTLMIAEKAADLIRGRPPLPGVEL